VLFDEASQRKKVFYPFKTYPLVELRVELRDESRFDEYRLNTEDFIIEISLQNHSEEVESWNRIFKIKHRFQAKMCQKLTNWTSSFKKEYRYSGISNIDEFISNKLTIWEGDFDSQKPLKRALFDCLHRNQILTRILVSDS
jgi:hypothetical protein